MEPSNLLEMLPETSEPLKLTTINNDCKELIFDHLEWPDMINIADSSKKLYTAVCTAFKRKYGNAKIEFGGPVSDSFSTRHKLVCPDILVTNEVMALKFMRNFGHFIYNLQASYGLFRCYGKMFEQYLDEYASESLVQLSLAGSSRYVCAHIQKPFMNVRSLHITYCDVGHELPFNKNFPNLQSLMLGKNDYQSPSAIRMHFFALTDLAFYGKTCFNGRKFDKNDVEELLKLNPQLEKLELRLRPSYCSQIILRLKEYCPNLKHLGLGCTIPISFRQFEPIHFDQIENFTLYDNDDMNIPFTFSKLKYLKISSSDKNISSTDMSDFIEKNPHLKSLKLELCNIVELPHLFGIESLLLNIEELSIGILTEDNLIPSDSLMNFLTRNRSLKTFSLTGRLKDFNHFYNAIITGDAEFKIRNKAIEFIVTRTIDQSPIKYVLRVISKGSKHESKEERERHDRFDFDYDNRLMECCSFDESPHLKSQMLEEYKNALRLIIEQVTKNCNYFVDIPECMSIYYY